MLLEHSVFTSVSKRPVVASSFTLCDAEVLALMATSLEVLYSTVIFSCREVDFARPTPGLLSSLHR